MKLIMKKSVTILFIVFCGFLAAPVLNAADYSLDYSSRYIWRGFDLNPDNKPVLQPSATFELGNSGISANIWGSVSFEDSELDELDLTLSYTLKEFKNMSVTVGFVHYGWYFTKDFKFKDHTTQEVFVSMDFNNDYFNPNLSLYYDFNNGDGLYASLGISHGYKLSEEYTLDLSATLGYNGGQWIEESGFSDFVVSASMPFKTRNMTISPFISTAFVLMDEVNPDVDTEFYYGVSLSF